MLTRIVLLALISALIAASNASAQRGNWTLVPDKPPTISFPDNAYAVGVSGCCQLGVVGGEDGAVAEVHVLCNDPLFEETTRRAGWKMKFKPRAFPDQPTQGAYWSSPIHYQLEGLDKGVCPSSTDIRALMNGQAPTRTASPGTAQPFTFNFAGSCGAEPALRPSAASAARSVSDGGYQPSVDSWRVYRAWNDCRAAQLDAETTRLRARFSGRSLPPGSAEAQVYLAASRELIAETDRLAARKTMLREYASALNARYAELEAEDRRRAENRAYGYDRTRRDRLRAAEATGDAYIESLSAQPHLRCLENAYTYAQEQACLDAWFGVATPQ